MIYFNYFGFSLKTYFLTTFLHGIYELFSFDIVNINGERTDSIPLLD